MGFPRASRAWIERFRKYKSENFLEGGFGGEMQMQEYIVVCFAPPTRARTSSPSLAVLRNIVNGGDGSLKCSMIFEICSIFSTLENLPMSRTSK